MERVILKGKVYIEGDLANFLKKEGVLQEFIEESNRLNDWEGEDEDSIDSISESFPWCDSNKGGKFWGKLNAKYFLHNVF